MFKTLILANLRNNSVVRAAQPAENNALIVKSIGPTVSEKMSKCLKLYSCKLRNNCIVGAAQPAEHNALTLRSIGPIVSEI